MVFIHQYVYVDSIQPIKSELHSGKGDESLVDSARREACRSVPGAVAWTVLTRAELAFYVQALQRRAHAPRVVDCNMLNLVIRHMKKHTCGLTTVKLNHPLKLVGFTDAAFKAQPEEPIGLALGGLAATLQEDLVNNGQPHSTSGLAHLVDSIVRRQRRVVRSTFGAELIGLVDFVERLLLLQLILHQVYCGTHQTPEEMIDLLEHGGLHHQLDIAVDARAVYDAVAATDACDPQECPLTLHLISVRNLLAQGIIRRLHWVDTRDMLADGVNKGEVDRLLLHRASNDCHFKLVHCAPTRTKTSVGSATSIHDPVVDIP